MYRNSPVIPRKILFEIKVRLSQVTCLNSLFGLLALNVFQAFLDFQSFDYIMIMSVPDEVYYRTALCTLN